MTGLSRFGAGKEELSSEVLAPRSTKDISHASY